MSNDQKTSSARKGGRKEVLTVALAKKIVKLIRTLPDAGVPVTWKNIETHIEKSLNISPKRNVLSTKEWDGKKLIWDAYDEALKVESALKQQRIPKYANSSRSVLRKRITELEAKLIRLQAELDLTREKKYDELSVLWARSTPLNELLDECAQAK